MQVSWARKKPQNHTTQKKKENKIKRKQRETKVKNVIVPVLVFLFSVFVFALCFLFLFFFIAYTLETVFTTVGQQWFALFRGKVRLEFLKFGLWKSVVIWPNCGQITRLFYSEKPDRIGNIEWWEKKEKRERGKQNNQCCTLCFYIVYFEDSVSTKKSA